MNRSIMLDQVSNSGGDYFAVMDCLFLSFWQVATLLNSTFFDGGGGNFYSLFLEPIGQSGVIVAADRLLFVLN